MRFDERLRISADVAYEIEMAGYDPVANQVVISSGFHLPLAFDVGSDGEVCVRAATGDEVTDALTAGIRESDDPISWPGDAPVRLSGDVSWRANPNDVLRSEPTVRLWAGEVLFKSGQGRAGPFFVHEMAASAWAFSTSLDHGIAEMFECQIVPYACGRQFAPALLLSGDPEARRLARFDVSPLRTFGPPKTVSLPNSPHTDGSIETVRDFNHA